MENKLQIALVQTDLVWEDASVNKNALESKIKELSTGIDLIILPEMFTTAFTMNPALVYETMDGSTVTWLKQMAADKSAAICGSLIIKAEDHYYNRFVFVEPNGLVSHYDKRHTFTLAGENKTYSTGLEKLILSYKGWKICPLICYDLRFPVWSRNTENFDVLIYVANWPSKRVLAWDTLLRARAIENMVYTVGVNRIGKDATGLEYIGHSAVYDALGSRVIYSEKEEILQTTLYKSQITQHRNQLKFLEDRDQFTVN